MKISLNTIRGMNQRNDTNGDIAPDGVEKLVEKIGAQLGGVDEVIDVGKKYQGIVVAKVVSCVKHDGADNLKVCKIDDGGVVKGVERDENGHVQVVCAAPNAREGIMVAWLPPGTTVPASIGKEPFVLTAKDFRGQVSNGMLASLKELAISDDHSGILELTEDKTKPGDDFAHAFGLDDYIIDIENKMFTHRPDLFGFLGVSRELAGIQQMRFKSPDWYHRISHPAIFMSEPEGEQLPLEIHNELPKEVLRFTAVTMRDVKVGPSPLWLQIFLAKMGQKSINNIVDYTNFFMHETAQPLHAYDYDKVKALSDGAATIVVRNPKKGEKINLLNGKEIEPRSEAIMIATDKKLIGIGGVMGGSETEVDTDTKNIIIECANFNMYSIRRTAMTHGLFTDAVTRFTKGQSPLQNVSILAKIVDEVQTYADGKVASKLIDLQQFEGTNYELNWTATPITTDADFINARLGLKLSSKEITALLENVEIIVDETPDDKFTVKPPFWRMDLEIEEDIVEEVGRLYGYDRLPLDLPRRNIVPVGPDGELKLKQELRHMLAAMGANETLSYSFVDGELLRKVGQDELQAYKLSNALSPDLQYYRMSLTPSLLDLVHLNIKAGYDRFALFELGKTHALGREDDEGGVPKELSVLSLVTTEADSKQVSKSAPFYQARTYLDELARKLGLELVYYPVTRDPDQAMTKPFNLEHSAFVTIKDSRGMLGIVGEYTPAVRKNLKLPARTSGFEIGIGELLAQSEGKNKTSYQPLSRYPGSWQDMCFQVAPAAAYKDLYAVTQEALADSPLEHQLEVVDIYQPDSGEYKNITLRLNLTSHDHTITADEVKAAVASVTSLAVERFKAKII